MRVERTRLNIVRAESARIRDIITRTYEIIDAAKALLSRPVPDTFLGRTTDGPFPEGSRSRETDAP